MEQCWLSYMFAMIHLRFLLANDNVGEACRSTLGLLMVMHWSNWQQLYVFILLLRHPHVPGTAHEACKYVDHKFTDNS